MHDFSQRHPAVRPRSLWLAHSAPRLAAFPHPPVAPQAPEAGRGTTGVAIVCSDHGVIRRMVWDDVGAARWISAGDRLSRLVRPADEARVEELLDRVRDGAVVSDQPLDLVLPPRVLRFKFFGCRFGAGSLLLVGSTSRTRVVRLFEQLLRTSSEQTATLRALLQDAHLRLQGANARNAELFAEVSRLRAEVATLRDGGVPVSSARSLRKRRAAGEVRAALRGLVAERDRLTQDLSLAGHGSAAGGVSRLADLASSLLSTLESRRD